MNRTNNHFDHKVMPERLVLFAVVFVIWLLLVWPVSAVDGQLLLGDIVVGVLVSAFVALVMKEIIRVNFIRLVNPRSWFWGFIYFFVFSYYAIKGGLDVTYRVLHPAMPIKPGIIKVQSVLRTETGRTALANSITLTPGTLTMEVTDDGVFYIHWLYMSTQDEEEAARLTLRHLEWYIQRIFE